MKRVDSSSSFSYNKNMKEKIITRNFLCTFTAQLCLALVMYTLMSTITEYVTTLGASATIAGLVSGVYVVGGLFSRIYSGSAMQRHGWKQIALIFSVIHFAASVLYPFCGNTTLLLLVRFVHGIGFGATMNSIMLIAMSSLPKSRYGEAAGYFMMSTSLGVAIGPFLGGLIYDAFGGKGCFTAASIFSFCIVISVLFSDTRDIDPFYTRKNQQAGTESMGKIQQAGTESMGKDRPEDTLLSSEKGLHLNKFIELKAIPVSLCIFCLCFGYAALMSFYRLYAQAIDLTRQFSYFFLIYAAVLLVSRPVVGRLQDELGDDAVCYPCMSAQVIGLILLAWKPCMATIVVCAVCGALGYGTLNSVLNVIVNRRVSNARRPHAVTTYWAFSDLGVGIAPVILGAIVGASGFHVMYYAAAGISLLALPIYLACKKR